MIKMTYTKDIDTLKNRYLALFDIDAIEAEIQNKNLGQYLTHSVEEYILGDFRFLADAFETFVAANVSQDKIDMLSEAFDYTYYHDKLAAFFMDPQNGFNLKTCHYCNTAYINSYGWHNTYGSVLEFINHATEGEWRLKFDKNKLSELNLQRILEDRKTSLFTSEAAFDSKRYLSHRIGTYKCLTINVEANHFDLDHVLPKSKCPLVALSLFNFVPSCQVCNEKLKGAHTLGTTKQEWIKLSPTDVDYSFDRDVDLKLVTDGSCTTFFDTRKAKAAYRIEFDTSREPIYDKSIDLFRLRDRYNFHKQIALRILDLKERYADGKISEISRILSADFDTENEGKYTKFQIYDDIFNVSQIKDQCFYKLIKDMIERN